MTDNKVNGPPAEEAKAKPKSGGKSNKDKRDEEAKKARAEKEIERREYIIQNMRENGFYMRDEAVIDFMEGYMEAMELYEERTGRPTKYFSKAGDWAIFLGGRGYSMKQIAAIFGVSHETLYAWGRENSEFSDALTRARELAQTWWETVGQAALFAERFQFGLWNKVVSTRFRRDYTDRKGVPYDPKEPETVLEQGEVLELDPRDLTEEQKKVLKLAFSKAKPKEIT